MVGKCGKQLFSITSFFKHLDLDRSRALFKSYARRFLLINDIVVICYLRFTSVIFSKHTKLNH